MLLTPDEIAARVALYENLRKAYAARDAVEAELPTSAPAGVVLSWPGDTARSTSAVSRVLIARWDSLREAALSGVRRLVVDAEEAVKRFEAGQDVDVPK